MQCKVLKELIVIKLLLSQTRANWVEEKWNSVSSSLPLSEQSDGTWQPESLERLSVLAVMGSVGLSGFSLVTFSHGHPAVTHKSKVGTVSHACYIAVT